MTSAFDDCTVTLAKAMVKWHDGLLERRREHEEHRPHPCNLPFAKLILSGFRR